MVDVFEEVDEHVRSDHFAGLARRALPGVLAVVALVVVVTLGAWGYQTWRTRSADQASQAYSDGEQALTSGDAKTAFAKFAAAAAPSSPRIYQALAQMQEGGIRLTAGDTAQAVGFFDQAAKDAPDATLAQLARLKSALALLDTAGLADEEARLTPLTDAKSPFHALAREALAMARLKAGKTAQAKTDFGLLNVGLDVPDDVRERAKAASAIIADGSNSDVAAVVKAAVPLPLPPPTPPQQSQFGGAGQ